MEKLFNIVDKNKTLNKKTKNFNRNIYSMSYLIYRDMTQSQCIKFGLILEDIFKDIILNYSTFIDIKEKNSKNVKEKDHLFLDLKNKIIYYAEIKTNMYLDNEKTKATLEKCNHNHQELVKKYPDFEIKTNLVCLRYIKNIPKIIVNKFKTACTVNEYFKKLGIKLSFEEENYKIFINYIADKIY